MLDLSLSDVDVRGLPARVIERLLAPKVLMLTVHDEFAIAGAVVNAGASAVVPERSLATDLMPAVDALRSGNRCIPPGASKSALNYATSNTFNPKGVLEMKLVQIVMFAAASLLAFPAAAQTASDMQILAQKVKADRKLVVAANMQLTDEEAKGFWPVYDAYQAELEKINKRLLGAVKRYADVYNKGSVPDETARKLINEAISIEEAEVKLKRSYLPKLEKVVPGMKAARYLQLETKIRAGVRYELAAQIPLVN